MEETDTVVIGAGAAGLACERELVAAGVDVVVVESRNRIGGRIETLRCPGRRALFSSGKGHEVVSVPSA